jgi:hypothetical protein
MSTSNQSTPYEPSEDRALIEFLSLEDGNSSPIFQDYLPTKELVGKWIDESMALLDLPSPKK